MTTPRRAAGVLLVLGVVAFAVLGLVQAAGGGRPSLEERVAAVAGTIRCPTCQGLSVEDSSSVLAGGAREVIEQQLADGRTPDQVRQYFVDRYGQQVLLSPDPAGPGLLVWLVPALAVPAVGALLWARLRRARGVGNPTPDPVGDPGAVLAAYRDGTLVPDGSPAGDALHGALVARLLAEADDEGDEDGVRRADLRLAAAHRRYTARTVGPAAPARGGTPPRASALPRRLVTVGSLVLVVGAAAVAVALDMGDGAPAAARSQAEVELEASGNGTAELLAAAQARPEDPAAWVALGRAHDHAGEYAEALAAYDRALSLQPADDVVLLRAGLLVRAGSPSEALPVLAELGERYPDNPDVLLLLGLAQDRTGDPQGVTTLRRFLELDPGSPAAPGVRRLLEKR
ncbi:cytochrome c-type biogenesis protein CcmH [Blastococcus sp. BMG 814]|uniref:Cytochrome c-type biogenesis protein n=1 Tax=Blastococcus carthaginiensis TaxID=3050034 RepID=A0ABT9I898_9ACTN|nr:cytochrome c-type biogenesis protein CcmH [Blastococcus carthaginiensis]MDP5181801.1 cytochrome c-type biogenesis protein CcmH [Blastococcus carthaginiensis]